MKTKQVWKHTIFKNQKYSAQWQSNRSKFPSFPNSSPLHQEATLWTKSGPRIHPQALSWGTLAMPWAKEWSHRLSPWPPSAGWPLPPSLWHSLEWTSMKLVPVSNPPLLKEEASQSRANPKEQLNSTDMTSALYVLYYIYSYIQIQFNLVTILNIGFQLQNMCVLIQCILNWLTDNKWIHHWHDNELVTWQWFEQWQWLDGTTQQSEWFGLRTMNWPVLLQFFQWLAKVLGLLFQPRLQWVLTCHSKPLNPLSCLRHYSPQEIELHWMNLQVDWQAALKRLLLWQNGLLIQLISKLGSNSQGVDHLRSFLWSWLW